MSYKIPLFLLLGALTFGCQNNSSQFSAEVSKTPAPVAATAMPAALPETSVYNLSEPWHDQNNRETKLKLLRGKPQVVALIYSSCKGACPRIIGDMQAVEATVDKAMPNAAGYLLVTMDPEADSPARLKEMASDLKLGPEWKLLNGSSDQVQELAATLGVRFRKISDTDFAHSNTITVLDSDGNIVYQKESLGENIEETANAVKKYSLPADDSCCP